MQCMKCGRDIEGNQVFCDICREEMEKYPVKPGTVVLLPHYVQYNLPKRVPKRIVPHEEQIRRLKKRSRTLAYLFALALACAVSFGMLSLYLYSEYNDKPLPGQNYSVVGSHDETTAPTGTAPETTWD